MMSWIEYFIQIRFYIFHCNAVLKMQRYFKNNKVDISKYVFVCNVIIPALCEVNRRVLLHLHFLTGVGALSTWIGK